jgi:hypothetical protein
MVISQLQHAAVLPSPAHFLGMAPVRSSIRDIPTHATACRLRRPLDSDRRRS